MTTVSQEPTKLQRYEAARKLGRQDAKDGRPCLPELYFTEPNQWVAYVRGYESWTGKPTPLSRQAMRLAAEKLVRAAHVVAAAREQVTR